MPRVTLQGSNTPSTFLARGARVTVERTPYVDKLVRRGYVVVIAAEAEEPNDSVSVEVQDTEVVPEILEDRLQDEPEPAPIPARNASREEWMSFLTDEGVPFDHGASRNTLIATWDAAFPESEDYDGGTED